MPATGVEGVPSRGRGARPSRPHGVGAPATVLALSALPWVVAMVLAMLGAGAQAAWASHGTVSPEQFRCDDPSGIWHKLSGKYHDNLTATLGTTTAAPGETVPLTLRWEWRDWKPGASLTVRVCADVDATPDGEATPPFKDLGADPADMTVVHPATEPSARVEAHVDGGTELRPAVEVPLSIVVPATAPAGSEMCLRSAVFGDPADHRHSPPLFDVSSTVCVTVAAPPASVTVVPPPPTPAPSPEVAPIVVAPPEVAPAPAPPPPPEVLGLQVLPVTGAPIGWLAATGAALVVLGVLASMLRRRPVRSRPSR